MVDKTNLQIRREALNLSRETLAQKVNEIAEKNSGLPKGYRLIDIHQLCSHLELIENGEKIFRENLVFLPYLATVLKCRTTDLLEERGNVK